MTGWPVPSSYPITTPYGKRGPYWSCDENSAGDGIHTGADFACPEGTPLYATIAGEVRHRSYGSAFGSHQFAISPDPGQPFADGEVFYGHARSRVADGTRVQPGDKIGEVGSEGNVSGPHLHYEFHPDTKGSWSCGVVADPAPTLNQSPPPGDVYVAKLVFGQLDSDSVARLQDVLNGISLSGGSVLPVTGNYLDQTAHEVGLWQQQKAADKSVVDGNHVTGPQSDQLFAGTPHTVIHPEPPDPEPEPPDPVGVVTGFGLWKWYGGKGAAIKLTPGAGWISLGSRFKQPASNVSAESSEHHFLYARGELTETSTATRMLEFKFVRSDGDATAYAYFVLDPDVRRSFPMYNSHFESGSGLGGQWYGKVTGGSDPVTLTDSAYAKTHVLYQDAQEVAAAASQALTGLPVPAARLLALLVALAAFTGLVLGIAAQ